MYFWKLRDWSHRTLPPPPQLRSNADRQPASLQYSVADKTTHCCTWWHRHWCSLRMHGNCKKQRQKPKHAIICKEYCRLKICRYVKTGVPSNNTSWCKTWWMRIHRKNVSKQELCKLAYFNYQTSHRIGAKMWFFCLRVAKEDRKRKLRSLVVPSWDTLVVPSWDSPVFFNCQLFIICFRCQKL